MNTKERKHRNKPEHLFELLALSKQFAFTKKGWPDYLCWKDDKFIAVEIKPKIKDGSRFKKLTKEQTMVMDYFCTKGIDCFISDGVTVEAYNREKHGNTKATFIEEKLLNKLFGN